MPGLFDVEEHEQKTFNKPNYFKFEYGQHIVRILTAPEKVYTHYVPSQRVVFECPGDECPICKNNKIIYTEHPKDYRDQQGYYPRSERYYMNVLDRTPVKVCPECQDEVKRNAKGQWPPACSQDHIITGIEPTTSNKVKMLNISYSNALQLDAFEKSVRDDAGEIIGMNNYDVQFLVISTGKRKDITPGVLPANNDEVEVPEDALFDVKDAIIQLEPEEIVNLLKGVSLRDLFNARRAGPDEKVNELAEEISNEIDDEVAEIFKD